MLAKAVEKYIRVSPRKMRYVMKPLQRQTVAQALAWLAIANRRAAKPLAKAIASAFANAKQRNPMLGEDQVIISRLVADGGPAWKRFRAAAFGRASSIRKPTTHITIELDERNGTRPASPLTKKPVKQTAAAPPAARPMPASKAKRKGS